MKKLSIPVAFAVCLALLAFPCPATADNLLSPADLAVAAKDLPLKVQLDPVDQLQTRLDQLEASPPATGLETEALRSALELIQIARSLRLTSAPAARTSPLIAGL
jgi:hypothetical protein